MRPSSLATSREVILAVLVVLLLGLTGSTSQVPADPHLPQTPPAPAPPAVPPATSTAAREPRVPAPKPKPAPQAAGPRVPIVSAAPGRQPKTDDSVYPAKLTSKDLGLSLPVKRVGVTKEGDMELPETTKEVGWYRFGPHPSSARGTTVLAAHVDTRAEGLGPFSRLREAEKGDEVSIVDEAGRKRLYRVADVTSLSKKKIDWDQVFDRRGHPRLVMITCGGAYDQNGGYRDNVLVTAFPSS